MRDTTLSIFVESRRKGPLKADLSTQRVGFRFKKIYAKKGLEKLSIKVKAKKNATS